MFSVISTVCYTSIQPTIYKQVAGNSEGWHFKQMAISPRVFTLHIHVTYQTVQYWFCVTLLVNPSHVPKMSTNRYYSEVRCKTVLPCHCVPTWHCWRPFLSGTWLYLLHSQKQLAQWAVDVTAHFYACWLSGWVRCNFFRRIVDSTSISHGSGLQIISNLFEVMIIIGLS